MNKLRLCLIIIFFLTTCSLFGQTDFMLVQELNDHAQLNNTTILKDFYCILQKEPKLSESNTITLSRGQRYVFFFKGSKMNKAVAEIKIYAPNNKQAYSKAIISNDSISELRLLSSRTQNFIIEINKADAGYYNALILMTLEGN